MAAIAGYKGVVKGQTGPAVAFTNSPMTDVGATARTVFQITDATKRYWDTTAPVVQSSPDNTVWTTVSAALYTAQPLGGVITFGAQQAAGLSYRVSATAYPMATFAQFRSWSGDLETDMLETTALGGGGAKAFIPGLMSGTFSVDGYWVDSYFYSKLTARAVCVLGFYVDAAGGHYDCYTYANKVSVSDSQDATVDEAVDFQVSGSIVYNPLP